MKEFYYEGTRFLLMRYSEYNSMTIGIIMLIILLVTITIFTSKFLINSYENKIKRFVKENKLEKKYIEWEQRKRFE